MIQKKFIGTCNIGSGLVVLSDISFSIDDEKAEKIKDRMTDEGEELHYQTLKIKGHGESVVFRSPHSGGDCPVYGTFKNNKLVAVTIKLD